MLLLTLALAWALQAPATPADLATSMAELGSFEFETRTNAARLIRRMDAAVTAPALREAALGHDDEYVRFRAFVLLTGIDTAGAAAVARTALADRNDRMRTVAYQWYERHPDPSVLALLVAALSEETSEFVRPALTRAIAAHPDDPRASNALVPLVMRGEDLFRGTVIAALGDERYRDRGNAEQESFRCRCHRSRVDGVVAHVGAVIDSGDHDIGQLLQQPRHREMHAIGRGAIDEIGLPARLAHRQWPIESQRIGGSAAVALWRDNRHGSEGSKRLGERDDAGREIPVIVTQQDAHIRKDRRGLYTAPRGDPSCIRPALHTCFRPAWPVAQTAGHDQEKESCP